MTSKSSQYSVELSHNQLSFLHTLLLNYQYTWRDKGDNIMPEHVQDLLPDICEARPFQQTPLYLGNPRTVLQ